MHPAHPMREGEVTFGAGFSGAVPVAPSELQGGVVEQVVEEGAFGPGLAPWVGGRYGIDGRFDAGLTYTARAIRLDARRAYRLGEASALSLGIGASGLLPKRRDDLGIRVGGAGFDVPLLFGLRSSADIYMAWIGIRGGAELLRGRRDLEADPVDPTQPLQEDIEGWHEHVGGLFGFRIGFRYIYAVMELDAAMHWAQVDVGQVAVTLGQFSVAPAGALVGKF